MRRNRNSGGNFDMPSGGGMPSGANFPSGGSMQIPDSM